MDEINKFTDEIEELVNTSREQYLKAMLGGILSYSYPTSYSGVPILSTILNEPMDGGEGKGIGHHAINRESMYIGHGGIIMYTAKIIKPTIKNKTDFEFSWSGGIISINGHKIISLYDLGLNLNHLVPKESAFLKLNKRVGYGKGYGELITKDFRKMPVKFQIKNNEIKIIERYKKE